jgi:hypothetical protein
LGAKDIFFSRRYLDAGEFGARLVRTLKTLIESAQVGIEVNNANYQRIIYMPEFS